MSDEVQTSQTSFDHLDTVHSVISVQLSQLSSKALPRRKIYSASLGCQAVSLKDPSRFQSPILQIHWKVYLSLLSFRSKSRQ